MAGDEGHALSWMAQQKKLPDTGKDSKAARMGLVFVGNAEENQKR